MTRTPRYLAVGCCITLSLSGAVYAQKTSTLCQSSRRYRITFAVLVRSSDISPELSSQCRTGGPAALTEDFCRLAF